ncbi:DegT/DnrJ/EryC1/StrS family aminotransferase [Catenovulum adriaticum]|uniref:DegT/DnrJ/EryC1/StrS family aminotransferase n=1 Tax=Catenovulum adriaticum TaxID=2984846 RepID=A0ABY7AJT5_9ALTE|nr:DegT/DnrJ/EryC1/StrS family aminotransferase [Catenovulum sp. TS8]WAJ69381.1 DegT/DnrJ/EryC1/StrS family aminotransferase [Catenovulum sp. TS8]
MNIALNSPVAPDLKKLTSYLEQVNDSGWYTNFGPLHQELTSRLEEYLGVRNLLLVSNGTLALQVAYKVLGISNAITTPFSFVATTSSLLWQNIQTQFCDIDSQTYNLSPDTTEIALQNDPSLNGIVATHVYGNPCDVSAFGDLSKKYNTKVLYDAAHAFGIKVGEQSVLNFGDASTLSFHATKVFHTVEGGAIIFKHKADFEKAKQLINFGLDNGEITDVGINAKLNEYQCAVGLTLLDNVDNILKHRAELFRAYLNGLSNTLIETPKWHPNANYNGAYFPVNLMNMDNFIKVSKILNDNGIQFRPYFKPSLDSAFAHVQNNGTVISQQKTKFIICLPLHFYMSKQDADLVVSLIKKVIK